MLHCLGHLRLSSRERLEVLSLRFGSEIILPSISAKKMHMIDPKAFLGKDDVAGRCGFAHFQNSVMPLFFAVYFRVEPSNQHE